MYLPMIQTFAECLQKEDSIKVIEKDFQILLVQMIRHDVLICEILPVKI